MSDVDDFTLQPEGTLTLLYPQTAAAREWVKEHLQDDYLQWCGNSCVIEHRYVDAIVAGILSDGLSIAGRSAEPRPICPDCHGAGHLFGCTCANCEGTGEQ